MTVAIIFPHQLYEQNPLAKKADKLFLIEDELFFSQYNFHKAKLVLHRASMKYYESMLNKGGSDVTYVNSREANLRKLFTDLANYGVQKVTVFDPTDYLLKRRLKRYSAQQNIELEVLENPGFLTTTKELEERLKKGKTGYFMANFYKTQRKKLNILMNGQEPVGAQWSFDEENRKKLPKDITLPEEHELERAQEVTEAIEYVERNFEKNFGTAEGFNYPVTHQQAREVLDHFLANKMHLFGDYEDAIAQEEHTLFHSVLTPALNTGLLTPNQILEHTFEQHKEMDFPLNSLEGFVRQIIGWREFMRGIYEFEGVFERTNNHFNHNRKIPDSFYNGSTGIEPIDTTIKKILKTGYCHHIERLMILGNFMLLCEFDPDAIYQWFMELFIDAYDWVMVPNVYGMTQYSDGGLITTKPYISSSNYVLKMSDYSEGPWCAIWDGLYWRFIEKHKEEFSQNQRMSFMTGLLNRMKSETLNSHLKNADEYLKSLEQ